MGLTRKRDLRAGSAVWTAYRVPAILGARQRRSLRTDVAVVGAGISGALMAQSLTELGIRPLIVDRRRAALLGSTAASTALLQFELDRPLTMLSSAIGRRKAERVWMASRDAVNELRTRTRRLGINAHLESRPSLYLAGYELAKIIPPGDNEVFSTWAIATRRQPRNIWPQRALIWEASSPYLYVRATADGRVICGGEDEEFSNPEKRDRLTAAKTKRIERKLQALFPQLDTRAAVSWAGSFGSSPNGMPTIGEVPGYPRCYAVLGYGGNGITFSMLAATLITAAIAGRKSSDAKLFGFK